MLLLKPGVRVAGLRPEILIAIIAAERVCADMGVDCVITACVDGVHQAGSLHYCGLAVDLRSRDFRPGNADKAIARLKQCLGTDYDVVLETDHIHIEFQQKQPLTR
ncbi:MAG TPA: hypothetical protein VE999_18965 [Gemmataceae bacterium]|nr:hypothetical protein [Gemmataceae bacterium]